MYVQFVTLAGMEFDFSEEKNYWLKEKRGVSFEDIIEAMQSGGLLDNTNSRSKKHPNQHSFIVKFNNYVYAVPYVQDPRGFIFLKTIIPDRRLVKKYLKKRYE